MLGDTTYSEDQVSVYLDWRVSARRFTASGPGRLDVMRDSSNSAFKRLTERNFCILSELEAVATKLGRSMAPVAINWVANRPGVASVILGATKLEQLEFEIPDEFSIRLEAVSTHGLPSLLVFQRSNAGDDDQ